MSSAIPHSPLGGGGVGEVGAGGGCTVGRVPVQEGSSRWSALPKPSTLSSEIGN